MQYACIKSTPSGSTYLEFVEVEGRAQDYISGTPRIDASEPISVGDWVFVRLPAGWVGGWHVAPRRQFVIGFSGELHFETSDGQTFVLLPGGLLVNEDTAGDGHFSRVPEEADWTGALVSMA